MSLTAALDVPDRCSFDEKRDCVASDPAVGLSCGTTIEVSHLEVMCTPADCSLCIVSVCSEEGVFLH
jgi:hypothetical protein